MSFELVWTRKPSLTVLEVTLVWFLTLGKTHIPFENDTGNGNLVKGNLSYWDWRDPKMPKALRWSLLGWCCRLQCEVKGPPVCRLMHNACRVGARWMRMVPRLPVRSKQELRSHPALPFKVLGDMQFPYCEMGPIIWQFPRIYERIKSDHPHKGLSPAPTTQAGLKNHWQKIFRQIIHQRSLDS